MAATRIAINGFGRMGRLALRAAWGREDLQFVHVNELHGDAATAAHLLTFDSVHGRWDHEVSGNGGVLRVDGQQISYSAVATPGDVAWGGARRRDRARVLRGVSHDGVAGAVLRAGRAQGDRGRPGQG
jgi:glyceraldehyde-3-phosphate dehydrogenase/erythrose-4-phosphate dehydrogenase